ncbi:hypothetical protein DAPK24_017250 [Pichia kluyveri]|uniref:Very-long-chain (3R)-3-hydroxyacyl-CoA dehydratase n=1 Tax=Pichia kluyveri TaxID=36015 RepID=A0AAV5R1K5_PICKL|nr:hypothetical protein DAPK24_017250 [Pichia kluyveri]
MPSRTKTQKLILLANFTSLLFWIFLLSRLCILYPLTGARFLPGGIADFYINLLLFSTIYDLLSFYIVIRHIYGTSFISSIITSLAKLILLLILHRYPKIARSQLFPLLLLLQSSREIIYRYYNTQKVRTFNHPGANIYKLKNLVFITIQPIESIVSTILIFQSLTESPALDSIWPSIDEITESYVKLFIRVILVIGPISLYFVYRRTVSKFTRSWCLLGHSKEE